MDPESDSRVPIMCGIGINFFFNFKKGLPNWQLTVSSSLGYPDQNQRTRTGIQGLFVEELDPELESPVPLICGSKTITVLITQGSS